MMALVRFFGRVGEWATGLSDQTKKTVCILACVAMLISSGYKLYRSVRKLNDQPAQASPAELIEPLQGLFSDTKQSVSGYHYAKEQDMQRTAKRLDSLNKANHQ